MEEKVYIPRPPKELVKKADENKSEIEQTTSKSVEVESVVEQKEPQINVEVEPMEDLSKVEEVATKKVKKSSPQRLYKGIVWTGVIFSFALVVLFIVLMIII